jgi:hypothetical protein
MGIVEMGMGLSKRSITNDNQHKQQCGKAK